MRVAVSRLNIHVLGRSSQVLTGEIGLSEIQNVFAEVSICPETMELSQKSLRETHFEATATRFEFFKEDQGFPGAHPENPLRFLLAANSRCRRALFFRPRGPIQPGVFAPRQWFLNPAPVVF